MPDPINRGWLIDNLLQHSTITDAGEAAGVVETVIRANPQARETELLRLAVDRVNAAAATSVPPVASTPAPVAPSTAPIPVAPTTSAAATPAAFAVTKKSTNGKRPWYTKKRYMIGAAVLVILIVAGAAGSSSKDKSKDTADSKPTVTTTKKASPKPTLNGAQKWLAAEHSQAAAFAKAIKLVDDQISAGQIDDNTLAIESTDLHNATKNFHDNLALAPDSTGDDEVQVQIAVGDIKNSLGALTTYLGNPNPATLASFVTQFRDGINEWDAAITALYVSAGASNPPTIRA